MPLVVRQALASRLSVLPEMKGLLEDMTLLSGAPVRFWPSVPVGETGEEMPPEPAGVCARMAREAGGCRMCASFRQKLREQAAKAPAEAACDAELVELLVPVPVGGIVAGHLVVAGLREKAETIKGMNRVRHLLARHGVTWRAGELERLWSGAPVFEAGRRAALARVLQAAAVSVGRVITEHLAAAPGDLNALVGRAQRIVHSEYARTLRVPGLARRLRVSAAHLSRVFHQATGLRLVDYVARYRAGRARALLNEKRTRPVAEVAKACGFASISQFNRVFKTTYGSSPRKLRQRV